MDHLLLVCYAGSKVGIGHLSRLLALADTLRKDDNVIPEFLIFAGRAGFPFSRRQQHHHQHQQIGARGVIFVGSAGVVPVMFFRLLY